MNFTTSATIGQCCMSLCGNCERRGGEGGRGKGKGGDEEGRRGEEREGKGNGLYVVAL